MNHLSQNVMVLREFPDTNPPVILHFGPDIGDGISDSPPPPMVSPPLPIENRLYVLSHQGLVMIDLPESS
jgi:hypothetical protein